MHLKSLIIFVMVIGVILTSILVKAQDGPFGVTMGSSANSYPECRDLPEFGFYQCSSLPSTHPDMSMYALKASREIGVCQIRAITYELQGDYSGSRVRKMIDKLATQVQSSYGDKFGHVDGIDPASSFTGEDEWLQSISSGDRFYTYYWNEETGFQGQNGVESIIIYTRATESTSVAIVEFRAKDYDDCESQAQMEGAESLSGQTVVRDGPFGINIGSSPDDHEGCIEYGESEGGYTCIQVPKEHPDFVFYNFLASRTHGVCRVRGSNVGILSDEESQILKEDVDRIAAQVAQRYGEPSTYYNEGPGSPSDSQEGSWLADLYSEDKVYAYLWDRGDFESNNRIERIVVMAKATKVEGEMGPYNGNVMTEFVGDNYTDCLEEIRPDGASVF